MNSNSLVTILLCGHLCLKSEDKPLEPKEWSNLASILMKNKINPEDLFDFTKSDFKRIGIDGSEFERYKSLLARSSTISFELDKYSQMGINIITRADKEYPKKLKSTLKNNCPPLFYTCGNLDVLNNDFIGFVGSRSTSETDEVFTRKLTSIFVKKGFGIVTGGAKGIDQTASLEALNNGALVIEYLSNGMLQKIKNKDYIKAIRNRKLLLLSVTKPSAGFNAGIAMMRNKYIYANSQGTIVVKSDYNKGGTWTGAIENLRNEWCKEYCWNNDKYYGNISLINNGAIPVDEKWNGDLDIKSDVITEKGKQIALW